MRLKADGGSILKLQEPNPSNAERNSRIYIARPPLMSGVSLRDLARSEAKPSCLSS